MGDIVITPASNDVNSTAGTLNIRTSDSYPMLLKTSNVERISITAAGLVGIGTTAPTGKLHIYSSITGDTLIRADGTNGTIFSVTDDLSNSLLSVNNSAGLPVLEVFADDSVVMGQYGSGDLVVRNNKVGIGTTSPNRLLEIKGSNSAPLRLNTSLGNCAIEFLTSPSTYSWLVGGQYSVNNSFEITPSTAVGGTTFSTPSIVVKSDGNVGINTTNPSQKLEVQGNIKLGADNAGSYIYYIKDSEGTIIRTIRSDASQQGLFRSDGWGNFTVDNSIGIGYSLGGINFASSTIGNGNLYVANRVGVGTTVPTGILTIQSNANQLRLQTASGPGAYFTEISSLYNSTHPFSIAVANNSASTAEYFGIYADGGGSNNRIALLNGNVGVGLTNPTEKLHVTGYILTRSRLAYTQRNDVVKNGLSFYVDFNNKTCFDPIISATSIKDISNNNYSLSLVNAATISNKDGNTALYTANNSSYLQIASYEMALPHTWEAWVNGDAYAAGGSGWDTIWDSNTERPLIGVINGVLNVYPNTNNCGTLTAGKWYHIVVTADASSNIITFINGVQTASFAYVSTFATGTRNIWLGGDVSAETFNGYIPIARTYNRVLSATEVMQNYNAEKWRFDNSSSFYHNVADGTVGLSTTTPSHKLHVYARGNGAGILIESDPTDNANQAPALKLYPKSTDASERNWSISPFRNYAQSLSISSSDSKGGDPYSNATTRLIIDGINGNVGIGTIVPTGLLNVTRNSNTAQPIAFFKELFGTPPATNILLLERGNNLTAPNQVSSNAGLRIRDHSANYSLSVEDHNSNVNFAISGTRVMVGSRGTSSLLNIGGAGSTTASSGITFGEDAQANLYRLGEDSIKTDGNLYVAGDTLLQGNKYLTNFKSVFIFARGTGANNSAGRYLLMNSTLVYDNTSRGLRLTIINATNLAVVSNTDYDTYGSDAACDDLATAINGMTSQQIGILTSFDAWERGNANLRAAALNVGLTKLGTYSTGGAIRKPYAAVFNGTSDTANATTKHVIERMESSDADATRALITTYLTTDGTYASIDAALHMPNALYASDADIEYPIVAVNSVGNVGIGTTAAGTKLEVYGVLRVTESSSGGILQLSAGASNVDIASTFYGGSRRPITFTVDSERVRIDAAGRVGIGTNNPVAYLHVTGQTFLNNVVASTARNQLTINTNGANYAHFYDVGVSANNALAIGGNGAIGTVPTKAIMSWRLSTENVGIGLTNPEATSALHIKNLDAAAKVTIESADASESYINFSAQSSEYSVGFVRDGSNVNSLRFCNADSLSANEVMRLQNTNVGIGTNNPIFGLDVYKDTFRSLSRVAEKIITVIFPHNVANQKVDIIFDVTPGTVVFWGNLEVEIVDEYNNQLATGKLIKVFALGLNPATGSGPYGAALYDNTSYYTAAYGAVADNYAIDGIFFNTTTGKYYFTIIHRNSSGNTPAIKIKGFSSSVTNSVNINSLTASAVYTTNTTVYYKPVVETLQSRIGFNGNINQSADLLVRGLVGLGTTNPSSRLVLGSNFASVTGITVSTDNSLESQFVARKAASKCAFGILAWEAETYLSAGIYYNNGNWQQHNANNNNLLFVLVPGGGVNWYASNNGSPSWNVTEALNLWDEGGRWKSSIRSTRAEDSYILNGKFGIGTSSSTTLLSVGPAGSTTAASGITFGADAQANLYRSAEDTIKTDGSLNVAGLIYNSNSAYYSSVSKSTTANWGQYTVVLGNASYSANIIHVSVNGGNLVWAGTFLASCHVSYRPNETWINVKLLECATYNCGNDDVTLLALSNSSTSQYGVPSLVLKTNGNVNGGYGTGYANNIVVTVNGPSPNEFVLSSSSWAQPYTYRIATSANTKQIYVNESGNVGIGTVFPTNQANYKFLQVNGTNSAVIETMVGGARIGGFDSTASALYVGTIGNFPVIFRTAVDEKMRIAAGGNVGIGTTNPTTKLVVMGEDIYNYAKSSVPTAIVADSVPEFLIGSTDNIDGEEITLRMGTVLSSYYTHGAYIKAIQGAGVDYYKLAFGTSNGAAATTKMTIANDGNVGIGATNPLSKLYVEGGSADWNETTPGTAVGTIHLDPGVATDNYGNAITFGASDNANGTAAQAGIYTRSDGGYGTRMYLATTDSYAAGSKTRILINHDGNVCIGAASPQSKLDVRGTLSVYQSANSDYIYFDHAGVNTWRTRVTTDNTSTYVIGNDTPGVPLGKRILNITNAGNLGIGVVSPATLLGVGGAGSATAASGITFGADSQANLYRISSSRIKTDGNFTIDGQGGGATSLTLNRSSTSSENGMSFNTAGSVDWYYYVDNATYNLQIQRNTEIDSAPRVRFNGANSDILFNLGGGNIGVGTATPTGKLHIYSTITGQTLLRADGTNGTIFSVIDDLSNSLLSVNNSAGIPVLEVFADDSVVMGQYGSGDLVVANNKVGIGTTNPNFKLTVNGDINILGTTSKIKFNGVDVVNTAGGGNGDMYLNCRVIRAESNSYNDGMFIGYNSAGTTSAHLRFYANGATERMRIQANDGFVGIGTDTAVGKLDIYSNVNGDNVCFVRNASAGNNALTAIVLRRDGNNNGLVFFTNSSARSTDGGVGNSTIRTDNGKLLLGANGTTYHALETDGNVGIGLTNPAAARLHIKGNGTAPVLRVETAQLVGAAGGTAGKTFVGWMPIQTGAANPGDTVFIPLYK